MTEPIRVTRDHLKQAEELYHSPHIGQLHALIEIAYQLRRLNDNLASGVLR